MEELIQRCSWATTDLYKEYHDNEWGKPVHDENALKGEYDSVSDEMGSIYYKGFSEEEITRFEECLDRIRKNLEEWQKS